MAKRAIKREEIIYYLQDEGFKEIKAAEKVLQWYKKASELPSCLKTIHKKRGLGVFSEEKGAVLIIALIFLILLTALGTAAIYNTTTEVKIASNTKVASVSLYIAEGGMEAVKSQLNQSAINFFSIDGGTNRSITGDYVYTTSADIYTAKTLRYPLYWVDNSDNTWKLATKNSDGSFSCNPNCVSPTTLASGNAAWPIYKEFTIGDQKARVFIDTPQWYASALTKVIIPSVSQHIDSNPMKKVSANVEIEFGNNLLIFQSFRDLSTGTAAVDNSTTSDIVVADPNNPTPADSTRDYGIGGTNSTDRITGIYTGADSVRIRKSTDGGVTWVEYALTRTNPTNGTFIIGGESVWGASTSYTANNFVYRTTGSGHIYGAITAGTSGATEPTWPTDIGAVVADGTVVWQEAGCMYSGSAFPVSLTSGHRFKVDVVSSATNCN
ncbi:MAG: hypothetical protein HY097_00545 [Nitrospinae bacterium]|nr:hypothetical protein [Nitrospinota bacterium]